MTLVLTIGVVWLLLAIAYLLVFSRDRRRQAATDAECARCGGRAYPVPLTVDRHACPRCGHQFAGPPREEPPSPSDPDAN